MGKDNSQKYVCKLCNRQYTYDEMSEEHYPAKSVGNDDIGNFDLTKFFDIFDSESTKDDIYERLKRGENIKDICDEIFDNELFESTHQHGRTARTLCKHCNHFLGKYDEAYLKFFKANGSPKVIKGFKNETKYEIIKSIYAKFLSVPETINENFDFINFINKPDETEYNGIWNLYFIKRDYTSDLLGLCDIGTGKLEYENGIVYELSDEKFIFNLMNFKIHSCYKMTNIFDILTKNYELIEGVGETGGYHGQIMMLRLLNDSDE